ncbi:DegQ family serine endoprotease [Limnohabitans sp. TEGF004]|uniref:DegQ family serine endoprotease n=1 Tax=Limnohabitans sp. TEGF004 TaxID=2986281 RepID=UPI002377AE38|nr:DegQ family serine endoprotease [Limnohabitans sp. TEGF004]BDU56328.1 peptidase [Limnohabitans sp. TEGF004]
MARPLVLKRSLSLGLLCASLWATGLQVALVQPAAAQIVKGLPDFTELVEQVGPSVVNIRTLEKTAVRDVQGNEPDAEMQEFFRRFFGVPMPIPNNPNTPRQQRRGQPEEAQPKGVGSGFILSADGFVMTNAHVVDGADQVLVTLPDKREFKARIVGSDKRTDVAVVKIDATGLPAVKIGDVNRLKVGEWVMAIGSPFGLDNSVTAGIVSAKQRDTGDYLPFIQTDVAINPGNSGGPLINMRGEVVGINSQIYSRSGGFMGISFAIPIDEAVRVSEQLRATGKVQRGRLGVQIDQVNKEVAESLGLSKAQGALVRGVEQGSPAEKASLEPGDIILKFEGKAIEKSTDLPRMVGNTKPGTRSAIQVWRRGSVKDMYITVGEFEADKPLKKAAATEKPQTGNVTKVLGLTVGELTDAQKKELKLRGGVRVDAVAEPASRAGIQEGDVILALANIETLNVQTLEALTAKLDRSKPVSLLIRRGEWAQYTVIRPAR